MPLPTKDCNIIGPCEVALLGRALASKSAG